MQKIDTKGFENEIAASPAKTRICLEEGVLKVAPAGRLDTVTSAQLKEELAPYDAGACDIEMDFADVDYISSAGLRLLVSLQKQAKAAGHGMVIKNINAVVKEVFRVSGFNKAFTVV